MYKQQNYPQKQGDSPNSIAQKGSLLVASCNLLTRFDKQVDPASLNKLLTRRGIYLEDQEGYNDELGWHSITAYDGTIQCEKIGGPDEWPTTTLAIMSFADGTYHLVEDASAQTIIDSWDGTIRYANTLGPHTGWASYGTIAPLPVPLNPNAVPEPTIKIRTEQPDINIHYEMLDTPRQMYIIKEGGATKWAFGNVKKIEDLVPNGKTNQYENTTIVGIAKVDLGEDMAGFYMDALAWGDYATTGAVKNTIGYGWADLAEGTYIPPVIEPTSEPVIEPIPNLPPPSPPNPANPNGYKTTYRPFSEPELYRLTQDVIVQEFDGRGSDRRLKAGRRYEIAGVFTFDGMFYGRPYGTEKWFGIDMEAMMPVDDFMSPELNIPEKQAMHRRLSVNEQVDVVFAKASVQYERLKNYKKRFKI